jgi:hypothetical protein
VFSTSAASTGSAELGVIHGKTYLNVVLLQQTSNLILQALGSVHITCVSEIHENVPYFVLTQVCIIGNILCGQQRAHSDNDLLDNFGNWAALNNEYRVIVVAERRWLTFPNLGKANCFIPIALVM